MNVTSRARACMCVCAHMCDEMLKENQLIEPERMF